MMADANDRRVTLWVLVCDSSHVRVLELHDTRRTWYAKQTVAHTLGMVDEAVASRRVDGWLLAATPNLVRVFMNELTANAQARLLAVVDRDLTRFGIADLMDHLKVHVALDDVIARLENPPAAGNALRETKRERVRS